MSYETYIVRIHRRARDGSGGLLGVVEVPGTSRQAAFHDGIELASILAKPRAYLRARRPTPADAPASPAPNDT